MITFFSADFLKISFAYAGPEKRDRKQITAGDDLSPKTVVKKRNSNKSKFQPSQVYTGSQSIESYFPKLPMASQSENSESDGLTSTVSSQFESSLHNSFLDDDELATGADLPAPLTQTGFESTLSLETPFSSQSQEFSQQLSLSVLPLPITEEGISSLPTSSSTSQEAGDFDKSFLTRNVLGGAKSEKLTIALLKPELQSFEEAYKVSDPSKVDKFTIHQGQGLIVLERKNLERPSWLLGIEGYLTKTGQANKLRPVITTEQTRSGLIFIKEQGRIFVFTFGNGRFLLHEGIRDLSFGLRATLNTIDVSKPEAVRSFGINILGLNLVSKWESYSKGTSPHKIKSGPSRRIKEIYVIDKKEDLRIAFSGSSVILRRPLEIDGLPSLCNNLLNLSNQTNYRENFAWADSFIPEEKAATVSKLDQALLEALTKGRSSQWHLTQSLTEDLNGPESEVHAYRLRHNKNITLHSSLEELAESLSAMASSLTLRKIKKDLVIEAIDSSGEAMASSKVYNSLVFDVILNDGQLFVLNGGRWYNVTQEYRENLNEDINNLFQKDTESLSLSDLLPSEVELKEKGSKKNEIESAYNTRVAADSEGKLLLMDYRLVKGINAPDPFKLNHCFEVCDLLSTQGDLIHVKNGTHASSFSHLLSQGKVSALNLERKEMRIKAKDIYITSEVVNWVKKYCLQYEQEFDRKKLVDQLNAIRKRNSKSVPDRNKILRNEILSKIPDSVDSSAKQELEKKIEQDQSNFERIISEDTFDPKRYTIVYAFFHDDDRPNLSDYLPFFSQENLRETEIMLRKKGFKVSVVKITKPRASTSS